jgi:hypothetical protein
MEIFAPVVGTHFRPSEAKVIANALSNGDEVTLLPEPENPYDPMAVAVYADDVHIGYLARANNYQVSDWLQDGGTVTANVCDREGNKPILIIRWDEGAGE